MNPSLILNNNGCEKSKWKCFISQLLKFVNLKKMVISTNIRNKRYQKGFNQYNMAQMLDISENTYRKIESGKVTPKDERLEKIAKILDTTVEELKSGGIVMNENTASGTNSSILGMYGTVNYHKSLTDAEDELQNLKNLYEKIKTELEFKDNLLKDKAEIINYQKEMIDFLKKNEK
jgi:transcriptional regulator with XRE-family HTH domain